MKKVRGSRLAGIVLALTIPLASAAYAAGPAGGAAAPLADSGAVSAAAPPAPLGSAGAASPAGGPFNAALPPAVPTAGTPGVPPSPYAKYSWKGINLNLPQPPNTVDLGLDGLRQTLADDYGIGYFGLSQQTFFDNVLRHNIHGPQQYVGQKPSILSQNFLNVTVDLSRYGIPDGQIVVNGAYTAASWNPLGPNELGFGVLSYYQSLFNKRLDVKVGLLPNNLEFVGPFVGGSLNGGIFGPQASLLTEIGIGTLTYPQAGINLTGHITQHVYDKFGIERAISPDSTVLEHNYNPAGISKFYVPDSGPLFINELGYLRPPAPGLPQTWVRADTMLSKSRYVELDHPSLRSSNNYALMLLADRQLLQTSSKPGQAFRGVYAGFSVEYVPPNYNRFSQYYEARLYGLGLIPGRPFDQISLVATETVFSDITYRALKAARLLAHSDSKSITASYSAQVIHGLYANGAVELVDHPSPIIYTGNTGSGLILIGGVSVYF